MSQQRDFYLSRAEEARTGAVEAQLDNVRDRWLRAEAAWTEMKAVCANLLGGISRSLKQDAEWRMELLDEAKKPVFRIRLVGEIVD